MPSASTLRRQIENALADRIPSALTPAQRSPLPLADTGIPGIDQLLHGGFPIGAITELVGPECSGRTSLAFSFLAQRTQSDMFCAWVDISGAFDPESAAANGIDLNRFLWVCCGSLQADTSSNHTHEFVNLEQYHVPPVTPQGLHGGGHGPHPQTEIKGLSQSLNGFLQPPARDTQLGGNNPPITLPARSRSVKPASIELPANSEISHFPYQSHNINPTNSPWSRLDQAMRVTDLLLQGGGFASIVLDAGSIAPEHISRVPLATWFRYRSAAERTQTCLLLLTQHSCSKSSAALVLNLFPGTALLSEPTVFTGIRYQTSVTRGNTSPQTSNVISLKSRRHSESLAVWNSYTPWRYRQ